MSRRIGLHRSTDSDLAAQVVQDRNGLPASVAFDMSSEVGINLISSRGRLAELIDNLGDSLPSDIENIRREGRDCEFELPAADQGASTPSNDEDSGQENSKAGPTLRDEHAPPTTGETDFEAEWARLSPAVASLASSSKIKDLVLRNVVGDSSYQQSVPVEANGLDLCYLSRPTFRHVMIDFDSDDSDNESFEPAKDAGLLPPANSILALGEALWECHFGVPRELVWYSAYTRAWNGVLSCSPIEFAPRDLLRLGLCPLCLDHEVNTVHCALAGAKRPLVYVGPTSGLLYAVVQGSLLLISWPNTEHNFEVWLKASRSHCAIRWEVLDNLEDPKINLLCTGDAVYLACGTTNVMMALSHVSLISRQVFNPTPAELFSIIRGCHRLIATYIDRQTSGYSPYDEIEADRMDLNVTAWIAIAEFLLHESNVDSVNLSPQSVQDFLQGLRQVKDKIDQYRKLVNQFGPASFGKKARGRPRNRPIDALNAVAKLSSRISAQQRTFPLETPRIGIPSYRPRGAGEPSGKGKERAPG